MTIFPIIMAGGPGARLWPESRAACPKPFLPLLSDSRSFIRATLDRLGDLAPPDARFVVVGKPYAKLVAEQAPELPKERVLLEPVGRDTAPCVAWAALEALRVDEDAALLVLPSDHLIKPDEPFRATIRSAVELLAEEPDALITLGVEPTFPSTVYGYIERGEPLPGERGYRVARFCEKPDAVKAAEFVATGRFFWNAGIFVWKARVFLDLLQRFEPEFIPTLQTMRERIDAARVQGKRSDDDPEFVSAFSNAKKISLDYAVLERAEKVFVLPASAFYWNDLGSYQALEELDRGESTLPNVVPNAASITENARGNYVRTRRPGKLVVLVDVDDLLVVETDDVLLVSKKGSDQALKRIFNRLDDEGLAQFL